MRLGGTIAVVTGASRGIGRAVALDLARQGAHVALLARDAAALDETVLAAGGHGVRTLAVAVDVADEAAVSAAFARIRTELGEPDVLVNAAGFAVWKPFAAITDAEHRRMMEVNYWGTFHCIRAALPGMRARRRGGIVNVAAGTGRFALAVTSGFSASKFAVAGLSAALYRELRGSGVQLSCLHPGSVATGFWHEARTPRAGIPPLVRYAPKVSPAAVARSVRYCLWFGFPVLHKPVFVGVLARADALWIRLGDLLLWKWLVPTGAALLLARVLLRQLGVAS
jgi:NAD(P)-dependent dehydrogenase (short-subunit alcohol dehydrogenase family)